MKLTTTLELLRQHNACKRGYNLIADHVGRDFTGEIDLLTILDNNGVADCVWALRAAQQPEMREIAIEFAIKCAQPHYSNPAWQTWATNWLNGSDRSREAAASAAEVARAAWVAASAAEAAWVASAARVAWAASAAEVAWAASAAEVARAAWVAAEAEREHQATILRKLLK